MKRALKCGISVLVFAASAVAAALGRLVGRQRKGSCVVLYYHSVPVEQRSEFARQLDVLLQHAKPIGVTGRVTLDSGVRYAAVTFDDAFENFVDVALPELAKRNIPSTMFVIADALGKTFGPTGRAERVMSTEQAQALPQALVTLGSHTLSHPFLPALNESDARRELAGSRVKLEQLLDREIPLFSFPFGGFSEKLVEYCRAAGYQRVFTTLPAFAFEEPDEFVVGRVRVDPTDWPIEFRMKLAGAYRWLPAVFMLKKKLGQNSVLAKLLGVQNRSSSRPLPQSKIHEQGA
jgi:peptidoglycan/xylan/chitin deacetylase (PgdA/CDA1 family)